MKFLNIRNLLAVIFLLILVGCNTVSNSHENVNDSTDITNEPKSLFEKVYENMNDELNYQFRSKIDLGGTYKSAEYQIDMDTREDGIVRSFLYPTGNIFYNETVDKEYFRIHNNKITIYKHKLYDYFYSTHFSEEEMTIESFMKDQLEVLPKVLEGHYYEIINNEDSFEFVENTSIEGVSVGHYKVLNENFDIYQIPYLKNTLLNLSSNFDEEMKKTIIYDVYIDVAHNRLIKVQFDLAEFLDVNEDSQFIVEYSFSNFGELYLALPRDFNYFEDISQDEVNDFNDIWSKSIAEINNANSISFTYNFEVYRRDGNSGTGFETNEEYRFVSNSDVRYATLNDYYDDDYRYITEEDGRIYEYVYADGSYVRVLLYNGYGFMTKDKFLPVINTDRMRYYTYSNLIKYEFEILADDFFEENARFKDLFENRYTDNLKSSDEIDLSDVYIFMSMEFDYDHKTLLSLNIDFKYYLNEVYFFDDRYDDFDNADFELNYSDLNEVIIDYAFKENFIVDDEPSHSFYKEEVKEIVLGEEFVGYGDYEYDSDVFLFEILDEKIYNFTFDSSIPYDFMIVDGNHNIVFNTQEKNITHQLSPGIYNLYVFARWEKSEYKITIS